MRRGIEENLKEGGERRGLEVVTDHPLEGGVGTVMILVTSCSYNNYY